MKMLSVYNTFTKKKEKFEPINPPDVKIYMCGPTVYDYFHIGNARSWVSADIIRKYLEYKGYNVTFAMNITDIDDKIIKKANEENENIDVVAEKYIDAFLDDLIKLGVKEADMYPKATEHMDDILGMIETLEDKGYAYNIDGNVFYDVSKFEDYGKLSGKKIEELETGSRVEVNKDKKNPLDFSLWKKAKEEHLGKSFDIHAGGNDLIFPHHENEIAQSVASNEKPFVKYWLHFGFLNIEEEKMSKSLGNFFTAREVLDKYSAEAVRLFFAQAYYRGPLNFSDELLTAAEKGLEKLKNFVENINAELTKNTTEGKTPDLDAKSYEDKFIKAMNDDFNTAQAVAVIFDFVKEVNRAIVENENINTAFYKSVKDFLERTAVGVLGVMNFEIVGGTISERDVSYIQSMIDKRAAAKKDKNYALADEIREELKSLGVELKDSKEGTTYKVVK
jgi:cysteinyl-tRNA synthetase